MSIFLDGCVYLVGILYHFLIKFLKTNFSGINFSVRLFSKRTFYKLLHTLSGLL